MKLSFGLFIAAASAASVSAAGISANSAIGQNLMSQARRLEQDNDANQIQWVADYSLKFQGCHHVYQWNDEVDEENDVRLYAKRLARFRMCPSDTCSTSSAAGCTEDFGDYVIDMSTYVNAYFESHQEQMQNKCENFQQNNCGDCEENDDQANCYSACFEAAGMDECAEFIEDENNQDDFQIENYLECAQWEPAENDGRKRRRLEEAEDEGDDEDDEEDDEDEADDEEDEEEEDKEYFIGPYCSGQGGSVKMGLFLDDTCTTFADDYGGSVTFKKLSGNTLPYSETSLVSEECFTCTDPSYEDADEDADEDAEEEVEINQACQVAYYSSGKCEYQLPEGTVYSKTNSACTYIDGIQIIREDGMVITKSDHPNAVATAFVVVFAMAFASMGFYVWYLRTRLGIKSDSLL